MSADCLDIALIASNRYPIAQPFAGGLEAHIWHLTRQLVESGHRVTLFAGAGSDVSLPSRNLEVRPLSLSHWARSDVSMPSDRFMSDHHAYQSLMLELAAGRHFDVVHNHSLHYLPVAMASMLATPMLTTLHTPPTPWIESAVDACVGEGARFAAVSRHTASMWTGSVESIDIVPNGVGVDDWAVGRGGDYLVWSGRFTPEKGPHLAIDAARLAGFPIRLAGPVSDPDYYAREIAPRLGTDVVHVGHLEQDELATLVGGAAAALVTPLWDEPYGLVVAEALACGTPVAAFARGGIPEIVSDTCGVLVPPGDVAALADAVGRAVSLSRTAVREHAERHCSARRMVDAYVDLYRTMIDSSVTNLRDPWPHLRATGTEGVPRAQSADVC
ncbi:glycosyltransferase family 4 protein [Rhodococcus sp. 077-4]|uniref:glycosyltransferase family 4 protein n=1 Tax=Rhodococcus sp. 077-4 TaxID=2789271 RepID=UPI0039F458A9